MKTTTDHRPRVNAERRARMRRRLIEAAMLVFAEKGVERSLIDDVMTAADVSRGGFYGHFRSMGEILSAVGEELGNELVQLIEVRIATIADPAERIAHGLLLYLRCTQEYPHLARFVAATGLHVNNPHNLVYEHLPRHIAAGNASGRLAVPEPNVALDLIAGTMFVAVSRAASWQVPPSYYRAVITSILMGLGMSRAAAGKLARLEVDAINPPTDSLLMRSHMRQQSLRSPI
ncbi:hypothetical protein BH10PSE16_BH10PSE16_20680 [soil metagenome]